MDVSEWCTIWSNAFENRPDRPSSKGNKNKIDSFKDIDCFIM